MSDNPFSHRVNAKLGRASVRLGPRASVVTEDGEITDMQARMVVTKVVDKTPFFKVFDDNLPLHLSATAFQLFFCMASRLEFGQTSVQFSWQEASRLMPSLSRSAYYRALKELIRDECIAKAGKPSSYYLNQAIVYRGGRRR